MAAVDPRGWARFEDVGLALLRLLVGSFLMWGTWDNISDPARMREFMDFMRGHGFVAVTLLAPLSVWAQFLSGALIALGLLTRWAGLVVAFNFLVAWVGVHWGDEYRLAFPALVLLVLGLYFAARGAGRLSLDRLLFARR